MEVNLNDIVSIYENEVKKNTRNKQKIYRFERFKMANLTKIYNILKKDLYTGGKYNTFLIKSPKYRIVMSQDIEDKIINHYVSRKILLPKLEKYLDIRNIATRKNMGRDYGIIKLKKYFEKMKKYDKFYILKLDISKYFYSIDHKVLKELLKSKLNSDEYTLISKIIDSTNHSYINKNIVEIKNRELKIAKERIDEIKSLPLYKEGKGLPIGNMTSQILSIFYLHQLDHKIVHDYHLKYYLRYMDDFLILSENKEYLKKIKQEIEIILNDYYHLKINQKKTKISNCQEGFTFCGYHFKIINKKTIITVSKDTRKRVNRRLKKVRYLFNNNKMNLASTFSSINTYYYGFRFSSSHKIKRLVSKYFPG